MLPKEESARLEARAQAAQQGVQMLLASNIVRSDEERHKYTPEDRAEEARIKASAEAKATGWAPSERMKPAQAAQEDTTTGFLSNRSATEVKPSKGEFFSLLAPGSAAIDATSLLLDPGSGVALRLIAFSITAYAALTAAVFALTPTTRALSQPEHLAVALTLTIQVASLLHDAIARHRISKSERDTHLCIIVVKILAGLTNALLYSLPSTPFVVDMVTGRPNSMLRWVTRQLRIQRPSETRTCACPCRNCSADHKRRRAVRPTDIVTSTPPTPTQAEWCVLAFTMTFLVEAIDCTQARIPLLVAASQSLSTLCGLFLPLASALPIVWGILLVVSFLLFFVIFARLSTKRRKLTIMRDSLAPTSYPLVRAEVGMRLFWAMMFTWTGLTAVWTVDALSETALGVPRGVTSWCFIADCVIDCVAKALYTTAIMEQVDSATQVTNTQKEARKRKRLHG